MFIPVTNPALVAHWSLAVAAVDVQCSWCLVQASDGAARAQFDDLIGHVPQLESLQQVYVGHVPVLLKRKNKSNCSDCNPCCHCIANLGCFLSYKYNLKSYKRPKFHLFLTFNKTELLFFVSLTDLGEVIDLFANPIPQNNKHRHGHLHIALLSVVTQHLPHNGAEEAGGQMWTEERLGDGDERERFDGCQTGDFGLVAADVRGVGLVLLKVLRSGWVIHDLVAQLEGLLGQRVLLLLCWNDRGADKRQKDAEQEDCYK